MTPYEMMALQLQIAREKAGKTQKDAAEYLGCTYQAISNWERSKTKIDSVSLMRLLEFYGADIYEFMELCGVEEMRRVNFTSPSDELNDYLELLRTRPECRMLFSLAKNATKEDVEKAVAIIEALRKTEGKA